LTPVTLRAIALFIAGQSRQERILVAVTFLVITQTSSDDDFTEGGRGTIYRWDGEHWPSHDDAIVAGWTTHGPDFTIGRVEDGELVWLGWMFNHLPDSDLLEISRQLGLSARTSIEAS